MKTTQLTIITVSILLIISSCTAVYLPNTVNSPMFKQKGEAQLSGHVSLSGYNTQVAYAITDHVGIIANGIFYDSRTAADSIDNDFEYHKHRICDVGIGYFQNKSEDMSFEIFGGYGFGNMSGNPFLSDAKISKLFIQPGIYSYKDIYKISVTSRLVYLNLDIDDKKYDYFFLEPAFTGNVGSEYVRFIVQFGYSFNLKTLDRDHYHFPLFMSFGIQASIGGKKKQ